MTRAPRRLCPPVEDQPIQTVSVTGPEEVANSILVYIYLDSERCFERYKSSTAESRTKTDDGKKQPFLLRSKDGTPLYLAGLCNNNKGESSGPCETEDTGGMIDGIVIVTDKSDQGMVDVHDRRPVALTAADARHWLDPDTTTEHAAEIARTASRPVEQFEWFKVRRDVNNARNDGPKLIQPTEE